MHPNLLKWLAAFDKDCQENSSKLFVAGRPTHIYESLLMLGVERPNGRAFSPETLTGCDCQWIVTEERQNIARCEKDIRDWHAGSPKTLGVTYQCLIDKNKYIEEAQDTAALYESLHANHGEYNRLAHASLKIHQVIDKVRAVCLRDLRGPVKIHSDDPCQMPMTPKAWRIRNQAQVAHAQDLATFLVNDPKGWF